MAEREVAMSRTADRYRRLKDRWQGASYLCGSATMFWLFIVRHSIDSWWSVSVAVLLFGAATACQVRSVRYFGQWRAVRAAERQAVEGGE
jgi:protein-S-isoprenylcysteine O-methyltransferase Ste14